MQGMTKDQFRRKYMDSQTELHICDLTNRGGSTIKSEPGDRNITVKGKTGYETTVVEQQKLRDSKLQTYVHDAIEVRADEILDPELVKFTDLMGMAIKMRPKVIEGSMEHTYTFSDMVKNASKFEKDLKRAEEVRDNTVDADFVVE